MASAFGHAAVAMALGESIPKKLKSWKVILAGVICTIAPDLDVISFSFGMPYESFWGHRGFTHSLSFACIFGLFVSFCFTLTKPDWKTTLLYWAYFFICTSSHTLLDAMTNGGLGVALLSPWDNTRYFLPWRPIAVSPIGAASFFSARGVAVLTSEAVWIGIPTAIIWLVSFGLKRRQ